MPLAKQIFTQLVKQTKFKHNYIIYLIIALGTDSGLALWEAKKEKSYVKFQRECRAGKSITVERHCDRLIEKHHPIG